MNSKFVTMVNTINQNNGISMTTLSKKIKADKRTVKKMLAIAENLGLIKIRTDRISDRIYYTCYISPVYRKIFVNGGR